MPTNRPTADLDRQFLRGWQRRTLIEALAVHADPGPEEFQALAAQYDISYNFVRDFNYDNAKELADVRRDWAINPDNQFAGMWVQHRQKRVEEFMTEVRTINRVLAKLEDEGRNEEDVYDRFFKMKVTCLEIIAKELGQNKPTVDASGGVSFVINGIDLGALS